VTGQARKGATGAEATVLRAVSFLVSLVSITLGQKIERLIEPAEARITVPEGPLTAEQLLWLGKAEDARFSELETIRSAAKDWASTITAVLGAVGVVSLVKGPDQLDKLTNGWKQTVAIVAAVAILAALRGIVLAALAAQGSPSSFGYEPSEYRAGYRKETILAARSLQLSRTLVVIAALAVTVAVGMMWFGTEKPQAGSRVVAVTTDGTTVCGVMAIGKGGNIAITPDAGGVGTTINPESVRALIPTGSCP